MSAQDSGELEVLYEDNHLLGVVKPAGLLAQGDRTGDASLLEVAKGYIKDKYAKPGDVFLGLVHRLDRRVSGVVVLARTSKAASRLSVQFRDGTPEKRYVAILEVVPPAASGELIAHLAPAGDGRGVTQAALRPFDGSREARLRYTVLDVARGRALVEVELLTGRRHQIRAQFALVDCPILGDRKYGARAAYGDRIGLHARSLRIAHPVGGHPIELVADPPADWPWPPT